MTIGEQKYRKNYLSVDKLTAINSYGEYFEIGETVGHEDETVGVGIISSFEIDFNEIKAITDKGYAHIDFIKKISLGQLKKEKGNEIKKKTAVLYRQVYDYNNYSGNEIKRFKEEIHKIESECDHSFEWINSNPYCESCKCVYCGAESPRTGGF